MAIMCLIKLLLAICFVHSVRSALVWNTGGEMALFISIAIPIDLPTRHVFVSYNFEASYRLPRHWHRRRPFLRRGNDTHSDSHIHPMDDFDDFYDDYNDHEDHKPHHRPPILGPPKRKRPKPHKPPKRKHKHKTKPKHKPKPPPEDDYKDFFEDAWARDLEQQSLLSRTKFYHILSQRFQQHGFGTGDDCLLRLICEVNSGPIHEINGVLGSLMRVMFSPSSSQYEALPERYYEAERKGKTDNCADFSTNCKRSVLDLITRPLIDYIGNKTALL
ncbi:PREDICTED: uncharacterized protein LOC108614892 [Drosophila arizonae]|uniref:Uncharacterized protein LOC108614892 n=1 Tax=Drosophila arizonae TaxID=7263 RepID=A0ABM1PBL4_DROAR|nr:PREDICTED: uncharacterized protein LOC108614892 [Drosophila arizonae]